MYAELLEKYLEKLISKFFRMLQLPIDFIMA